MQSIFVLFMVPVCALSALVEVRKCYSTTDGGVKVAEGNCENFFEDPVCTKIFETPRNDGLTNAQVDEMCYSDQSVSSGCTQRCLLCCEDPRYNCSNIASEATCTHLKLCGGCDSSFLKEFMIENCAKICGFCDISLVNTTTSPTTTTSSTASPSTAVEIGQFNGTDICIKRAMEEVMEFILAVSVTLIGQSEIFIPKDGGSLMHMANQCVDNCAAKGYECKGFTIHKNRSCSIFTEIEDFEETAELSYMRVIEPLGDRCAGEPLTKQEVMDLLFCEKDWTYFSGANSCFTKLNRKLFANSWMYDFEEANNACKGLGASLAKIASADANAFVLKMMGTDPYWIGMIAERRCNRPGNDCKWLDGTTANYTNFYPDEPNGNTGPCVAVNNYLLNQGKWDDDNCDYIKNVACQRDAKRRL